MKQYSDFSHHTAFLLVLVIFHISLFFLTDLILVCCIKTKKPQYEVKCFLLKVAG